MNRFLKRIFIFFIPFVAVFGIVFIVDPFDYFVESGNKAKRELALSMDYGMIVYSLDYERHPKENVVFGDSRANVFSPENIPEENWHKMSFGGANIYDVLKSFWYVAKFKKIKNVILVLDVYSYSGAVNATSARFDGTENIIKHPYKYFTSRLVLQTCYKIIFEGSKKGKITPVVDEGFWEVQLNNSKDMCIRLEQNKELRESTINSVNSALKKIKDYGEANNIRIKIMLPAVSSSLYNIYNTTSPTVYREVMSSLVDIFDEIYDFGFPNDYTNDRNHYKDPLHIYDSEVYINTLWRGDERYCRIINRTNIEEILNNN